MGVACILLECNDAKVQNETLVLFWSRILCRIQLQGILHFASVDRSKQLYEHEVYAIQDYRRFITSNPNILFGKPAIKDTRIAVEHIHDELASGTTIDQLLEEYPCRTREAIYVAIAFAADTLRAEVIYPLDQAASW